MSSKNMKKVISIFIFMVLILSLFPAVIFAATSSDCDTNNTNRDENENNSSALDTVNVQVVWQGDKNTKSLRPKSIDVLLGKKFEDEIKALAKMSVQDMDGRDTWTCSFPDLNPTTPGEYCVSLAKPIDGYKTVITVNNSGKSFTITNTANTAVTPKVPIAGL